MELKRFRENFGSLLEKYKYPVLIFVIGIVLMLLPFHKEENTQIQQSEKTEQIVLQEQKLEQILSCIDGAGEVKVMMTEKYGAQTVFQTDEDLSQSESNSSTRLDTVILSDSERNETGMIRQINPPVYQGAIIVCQGADDPTVRLEIFEAVSKITGLGTDRIAVLKMKS